MLNSGHFPSEVCRAFKVSNRLQVVRLLGDRFTHMTKEIEILHIEQDGPHGLIATFSDGTSEGYTVEELVELRPHRLPVVATSVLRVGDNAILIPVIHEDAI